MKHARMHYAHIMNACASSIKAHWSGSTMGKSCWESMFRLQIGEGAQRSKDKVVERELDSGTAHVG